MPKIAICLVVKNEDAVIREWIAFHALAGFETFLILDDRSTDRTVEYANSMAGRLDVRVMPWTEEIPGKQHVGYEKICRKFANEFAWIAFLDCDEFLVSTAGETLTTLLDRNHAHAAIAIPWRMFGSSGHIGKPAGLVIDRFRYCAPQDFKPNRHVKSIVRPARVTACSNPHHFVVAGDYVLPSGEPATWGADPGILASYPNNASWQVNHYFTRSRQHWSERLQRGQLGNFVRTIEEFDYYDRNEICDDTAARQTVHVQALISELAGKKPETYAVVLVVKNEVDDILSWLAWYHVLGFDTCIIFDDHSTDGTWEVLQSAAAAQDIRLARTEGPRDQPYEFRQEASYVAAIKKYQQEFDWLAFFDADEFLLLNHDATIKSFLARFPTADAVAINWCNYGSNFHILKPQLLPIEAYTWHGNEQQRINRHVKSIIRPQKIRDQWFSVHCFDIDPDRYYLANGKNFQSGPTLGIIEEDPDWSVAKLMHYQCRSMEHFIERIKKRPDLAERPNIWAGYDLRQTQDLSPIRFADPVKKQIARLRGQPQPSTTSSSADLIFDIGMSEGDDSAFYLAKGFRVVGVEPDVKTYYLLCDRFDEQIRAGQLKIYNLAACEHDGGIIEFFHHDEHQGLSGLSRDRAEFEAGKYTSYFVSTINWDVLIAENGVPYYLKIDIEGQEGPFLKSMAGCQTLPTYISVECHFIEPVEQLYDLGYRHFKLVDQKPPGGFHLPENQSEGNQIEWPEFKHSSGPFGRELPDGPWLDLETFKSAWQAAKPEHERTWFDCHAWMG